MKSVILKVNLPTNVIGMNHLQPGLSGNPFYATQWSEKIGSGRRIKLPQIIKLNYEKIKFPIPDIVFVSKCSD